MPVRLVQAAAGALVAFFACGQLGAFPLDDQEPALPAATGNSDTTSATFEAIQHEATQMGIAVSFVYDGEGLANAHGGDRIGVVYLGNFHMMLTVDASRLLSWQGATLFFNGLVTHGGHPSDLVGDAQGVSNLEAPPQAQLYEAWLQHNLFGNQLSALVGRYDLSTEFYRLQSAALFLNSSFGTGPEFSQSGLAGPSVYPDTSVGIRVGFKPARGVILRAALLDGVPVNRPDGEQRIFAKGDGLLLVGEAAFLTRPALPDNPTSSRFRIGRGAGLAPYEEKIALGGWYYTAEFDDLSERQPDGQPVRHPGSGGAYAIADGLLCRSSGPSPRRLNAFVQLGLGDFRVNRFGFYAAGGLVLSGLLHALKNDELGVAVASARNGSHFVEEQRENAIAVTHTETAVEITYLVQIGEHVAIQPDFQYVMRPGTNLARKDALAAGVHFELSY
jgi:porin